uniref:Uncharacterized protein n=1 Tax=Amphimedon queenslandica TaxID=400682 RepID=A0A1X7VVV4_AMPQE
MQILKEHLPGTHSSPKGNLPRSCQADAIQQMQPPKSITEVRRFLGIVNLLWKFSPKFPTLSQCLRDLLKKVFCGLGAHHKEQHLQNQGRAHKKYSS